MLWPVGGGGMSNKLVGNEQRKLRATYFNGVAIAIVGVGGFAPVVATAMSGPLSALVPVLVLGCTTVSIGLHSLAILSLQGLEE